MIVREAKSRREKRGGKARSERLNGTEFQILVQSQGWHLEGTVAQALLPKYLGIQNRNREDMDLLKRTSNVPTS